MCGNGKCIYYGCFECYNYLPGDLTVYDDDGCQFCSEECRAAYILRGKHEAEAN